MTSEGVPHPRISQVRESPARADTYADSRANPPPSGQSSSAGDGTDRRMRMAPEQQQETLRMRTEDLLGKLSVSVEAMPGEARGLVEEMRLLVDELTLQNDNLRDSLAAIIQSRDKYHELYDLAPVAFLTLDRDNTIRETNLRAIELLGVERTSLIGQPIGAFVHSEDQQRFSDFCQAIRETQAASTCELTLLCGARGTCRVRMECVVAEGFSGPLSMRATLIDMTERTRTQEALQRSETRYRSIVETTLEGVILTDTDRRVKYVNRRVLDLLGYAREEMLDRSIYDFLATTETQQVPTNGDRRRNGTRERCFLRKDGKPLWALVSMSTMVNGSCDSSHHLEMLTDISERKILEENLRQTTERLSLAQRAGKIAAWDWDMTARTIEWCDQLGPLFGVDDGEQDYSFEAFMERVHPIDRDMVAEAIRACIDDGRDYEIEHRVVWPDGTVRWVAGTGTVVRDGNGKGVRMIGVLQDITRRKVAEEELHAARRRLEEQLETQSTRLSDTEHFLTIEITDRVRAEKNLTRRQQALEAVYAISMVHTDSPEAAFDQIAGSIAVILDVPFAAVAQLENEQLTIVSQFEGGRLLENPNNEYASLPPSEYVWRNRIPYQCADDLRRQFPQSATLRMEPFRTYVGVPIVDDVGDVRGIIMALDKKYRVFEADEIHLIEIFAGYIAHEYTRKRLEAQLLQSEEMRMLGQLTSGVAHEVRNPLSAISAIAEALFRRLGDNPQYDPFRRHLDNQVKRLSTLMEELLVLGRPVRQAEFRLHKVVDLVELALDCWHQAPHAKDRCVRVETMPDAAEAQIKANAEKIHQVLVNLLDNATHHSPPSEEILIAIDRPEEHRVRLRVVDRGCGIPPHLISRLMDPFFTTRKGGSGLGLSIVRHLVESHGGFVRIRNSDPGPGATVELRFPLVA
ncbi:MAG: PAS domain S-box protein [Chitinivibrionales bacterium]|nr:PAS domain S-box protein [Chitinivibrionales bacterium]